MPRPDQSAAQPQPSVPRDVLRPSPPHDLLTLAETAEVLGYPGDVVLDYAHRGLLIGAVRIVDQWRFLAGPIRELSERCGRGCGLE
jgi:hypothetical protein